MAIFTDTLILYMYYIDVYLGNQIITVLSTLSEYSKPDSSLTSIWMSAFPHISISNLNHSASIGWSSIQTPTYNYS